MTILEEKEVEASLHPQSLAQIDWDKLESTYSNANTLHEEWRVSITTKGSFDAIWYDRKGDSLVKRIPQNHPMTWFVKYNDQINRGKLFEN